MKHLWKYITGKWIFSLVILVGGILFPIPVSSQDISSGLVLHYSFENLTGRTVDDISGNGNPGTTQGNAISADGFEGEGLLCLDKADYIKGPDNINAGLTSFTFAAWVKINALKNATRFFDWGTGPYGSNNFIAFIPSYESDDGYMVLRFRSKTGEAYNVTSNKRCTTGGWAHVAVTYDWNGTSGTARIYLDGELAGIGAGIPYDPGSFLGATTDNYFGYSRWTQDLNGFGGIFDDLRIYNRALTSEDLKTLTGLEAIFEEYDLLDPGDLSAITGNITLPSGGTLHPDIEISWSSSQPSLVDGLGTVNRPDYFDYPLTLTATLRHRNYEMRRLFPAEVLADEATRFTGSLLLNYDFSNLEGDVVTDVAEKQFRGTLQNSASLVTIGTAATGTYNVLHTGNANGYFDMGSQAGIVLSRQEEFTVSAFYRIDESYTGIENPGNCLWTFSNSEDPSADRNGFFSAMMANQGIIISPETRTEESGARSLSFSNPALKGNWHHFAYTQRGSIATIYIDGAAMKTGTVSASPFSALVKPGSLGTAFNWLGRSPFSSESYLNNTLIWDLRIYSKALTATEISGSELEVFEKIRDLEKATNAYLGTSKTAGTAPPEIKHHAAPTFMEITNLQGFSHRTNLEDFDKMTFSGDFTNIINNSGGVQSFETDNILRIVFGPVETGINNRQFQGGVVVYPNPASDRLFIRLADQGSELLYIYSITGKVVLAEMVEGSVAEIDITRLQPGMYLVKRGIHTAKFTRQ